LVSRGISEVARAKNRDYRLAHRLARLDRRAARNVSANNPNPARIKVDGSGMLASRATQASESPAYGPPSASYVQPDAKTLPCPSAEMLKEPSLAEVPN